MSFGYGATLLAIKAKMLLPKPKVDNEDLEEDPREELVARLIEYRQYKQVAYYLREKEQKCLLFLCGILMSQKLSRILSQLTPFLMFPYKICGNILKPFR